jgi:Signal transduction histidine kinase
MRRSLFSRMLSVYLLIIVIAFALVGGIFFESLKNEFLHSQMDAMIAGAQEINQWYEDCYNGVISNDEMARKMADKATNEGTVIWLIKMGMLYEIADPEGKSSVGLDYSNESIHDFYSYAQQGKTFKLLSTVGESFKNTMMSVEIPLEVNDIFVGAIVVHKEVGDVSVGISSIFQQVFFPMLISVGIAAMLVSIMARHIVRPVKDIQHASRELARGNLDFRVKIETFDEIGELAVAFNKMAEELKLQDGLRNAFVGNVSHELRTPLAAVQGFIQGVLDGTIEEQDRCKYLEIALSETKRMSAMITDFMNLAKIESGKFPMEFSEFDINELLRRCILMFEQQIEAKKLEVEINLDEDKAMVWADEDRISQVITNLIDNAVKFSFEGGFLKIWAETNGSKMLVNIADTGEGIPEEDQASIFERFYKVDKSHSRGKSGAGIGLSIVKRIIAQHGEKIWLKSVPCEGTIFTFSLTRAFPEKKRQ